MEEYYKDASSCRAMKDVRIPLLCIQVRSPFPPYTKHREQHRGTISAHFGREVIPFQRLFRFRGLHAILHIVLMSGQARDDPIAPIEGAPVEDVASNPYAMLVVTPYGGHLGWVAGREAPFGAPWTDPLVMQYLVALEGGARGKGKEGSRRIEGEEDGAARLVGVVGERGSGM